MRRSGSLATPFAVVVIVAVVLGWAVIAGRLPAVVPGIYAIVSVLTFIVYAVDKAAAQRNQQRTPERTLHLLALIGGWPGALLAQQTLRHKSSKTEFQVAFWVTVVLNCILLAYLFT